MKTYKFNELTKDSQYRAIEEYAAEFYNCDARELNITELRDLLGRDRPDDNYDIDGIFINEDN